MPFGRRRYVRQLQRQVDDREKEAAARASAAMPNVVSCFCTDPDEYDVRAAIVWHPHEPDAPEIVVFKFGWADEDREGLFFDGTAICVREGVEVSTDAVGEDVCREWVGESSRRVQFEYLPGIYQMAFFTRVT